ncbi:Leucine-rich repeat transmembrane protein kinase isoform 1 [Dorcoceras hygrometricum]|uniref:non-specific serine/threonine protein kinase n=1 Tax=Dorcoceras hygrometricum TaxID=472368 RepID=A0A2Z7BBT0_9LAMI|nr:Leucine-rich repeat transmembrane protein kinase isoform 1 [Dorcoceras hygrometricum]
MVCKKVDFLKIFFVGCCASFVLTSVAQLLPEDEVQILQTISLKLQNKYWNVTRSSCTDAVNGFNMTFVPGNVYSGVACDCSFDSNTTCHVTHIQLKGLNLTGILPAEFANLTYLRQIDLTRNYINGTIPTSFGQLRLFNLSLLGNRISGSIPEEIANIASLQELVLEDNLLGGNLPIKLGSLSNLARLFLGSYACFERRRSLTCVKNVSCSLLSANNFTGTIPETYGNLRNLTDFRIDGSSLAGKIPDFIGNWTRIDRLDLQGTGMEGPIPATISQLKSLRELRITDLKGISMTFPNLEGMQSTEVLDLTFNMLNGEVPNGLGGLDGLVNLDVSYNNFTQARSGGCQFNNVNLVASHSTSASETVSWCLKPDLPCSRNANRHSLFINCGGGRTIYQGEEYEENTSPSGPSHFESNDRWAYSSTGRYMNRDSASFIAASYSPMAEADAEFYRTARLSPSSLKFYGLCLRQGSYKVRLHFAEIMYSDDNTFSSLGRRVFDVAIQGNVVLTDFDIAQEAKGVMKGIYKDFNVLVNGSTLEIHLYWTGKGTTAIPDRGVYGPLISAIAVTPNFDVSTGGGLSVGVIIAIVISSCALVALVLLVLWKKGCFGGKDAQEKELRALDLQTGYFSLKTDESCYKQLLIMLTNDRVKADLWNGVLSDGTVIAVKQLSSKSKQGNREFVNEIGMISALQHPNLVKLYGCCIEGNQLLLIYEYLENNCLARALFGTEKQRLKLNWATRQRICIGIARGLAYLHEESRLKIVHRDIKATNVLLDKDLNAKISDFGLAKLDEEENTHISTRIAGTVGYMAPEYAMRGYLTDKADVYSFGIVALEIVSGKSNTNYRPKEEFVYLLDWAYVQQEQGNLLELVDPDLESNYSKEEALRMLNVALLCANPSPTLRPLMSSVVSMLEGQIPVQAPLVKRGLLDSDIRFKALEVLSQDSQTRASTISVGSREQRGVSMDGPWIDSTNSLSSKGYDSNDHSSAALIPGF